MDTASVVCFGEIIVYNIISKRQFGPELGSTVKFFAQVPSLVCRLARLKADKNITANTLLSEAEAIVESAFVRELAVA